MMLSENEPALEGEVECPRCGEHVGAANVRCRNCNLLRLEFAGFKHSSEDSSEAADFELGKASPGSSSAFPRQRFNIADIAEADSIVESLPKIATMPSSLPPQGQSSTDRPREGDESDPDVQSVSGSTVSHSNVTSSSSRMTLPVACDSCGTVNYVPRTLAKSGVLCTQCGRPLVASSGSSATESTSQVDSRVLSTSSQDRRKHLKRAIEKALATPEQSASIKYGKSLSKSEWKEISVAVGEVQANPSHPTAMKDAIAAIDRIVASQDKRGVDLLVSQADAMPDELRGRAKMAWGELRIPGQFDKLINSLIDDVAETFPSVIRGLGAYADRRATRTLLTVGTYWGELHDEALNALADIGSPALPELVSLAERVDKAALRPLATEALGRIGDLQALPTLSNLLKGDRRPAVQVLAAKALGKLNDRGVLGPLVAGLKDLDDSVRVAVLEALQDHPRKRIVPALVHVLNDSNADVRRNAATLIGRCGVAKAVSPLGLLLNDPDVHVRTAVLEALARLGDDAAVPQLGFALNEARQADDDHRLLGIVRVLGELKDPRSVLPLLNCMPGLRPTAQVTIVAALGDIGDPSVLPALIDTMNNGATPAVRTAAVTAIGKLNLHESVEPLSRALKAGPPLRPAAVTALGFVHDEQAVSLLLDLLDDSDSNTRRLAASSLGLNGNESVFRKLRPLTGDKDARVAEAAVDALAKLGDTQPADNVAKLAKKKEKKPKKVKVASAARRKLSFSLPKLSWEQISSLDTNEMIYLAKSSPMVPGIAAAVLLVGLGLYFFAGTLSDALAGKNSEIIVRGLVDDVSISGDGKRLAVARNFGVIDVFDASGSYLIDQKSPCSDGVVMSAVGDKVLVSGSQAGAFWSVAETSSTALDWCTQITSNNDRSKAIGRNGRDLFKIDLAGGQSEKVFTLDSDKGLIELGVNADATQALLGYDNGAIAIWNESDAKIIGALQGPSSGVVSLAYAADGSKLAAGGRSGEVVVFQKGEPKPLSSVTVEGLKGRNPPINLLQFLADGTLLAVSNLEAMIVEPSTGDVVRKFPVERPADFMSVSSDGTRLAVANEDSKFVNVYDVTTGEVAWKVPVE